MANTEFASQSICRAIATVFNGSAPGANAGILGTAIRPGENASAFRVSVALTTSSVFNVTCYDGSTTHKWGLNESGALNAADLYTFTFGVRNTKDGTTSLVYNFEVETDGVIEYLVVEEIIGAAL